MRVVPIGGLGNRLRTILSWRAVHGPITAVWCRSDAVCHGRWEDAFEPLEGVTFEDGGDVHAHEYKGPHDVMSCGVCPGLEGTDWCKAYLELASARGLERVLSEVGYLDEYAAVHARRTDHVEHARTHGHFTTNEELLAWHCRTGNGPLYLATDCPNTRNWFRARQDRVLTNGAQLESVSGYEVRPGKLADAVIDLFMCARATRFMGSWFSSFSETVEILRKPPVAFNERLDMPSTDGSRRVR